MNVLVFSVRIRFLIISAILLGGITMGDISPAQADALDDARQYMQDGRDEQAVALLETWIGNHATDYEAVFLLGMAYAQQERYTKAIEMFHQVSALRPELAEPHGNLAVIYNELDRPQAAARELEIFLERKPGDPVTHENLGDIHVKLALRNYQIALARTKNPALLKKYQRLLRFSGPQRSGAQSKETSRNAIANDQSRDPLQSPVQTPYTSRISLSAPVPVGFEDSTPVAEDTIGAMEYIENELLVIPPSTSSESDDAAQEASSLILKKAGQEAGPVGSNIGTAQYDVQDNEIRKVVNRSVDAEVVHAIERWRSAWAAKDLSEYFDAYASDFTPSSDALKGTSSRSRNAWKKYKSRIIAGKAYIHIILNNMHIKIPDRGSLAIVNFLQFFDSNNYSSQDDKEITLKKGPRGWKIIGEKVL